MSDLPPPSPGQQPAWQPPAGPPPAAPPESSEGSSAGSTPPPIRPYLPDPRAPKTTRVPPQPIAPVAPIAPVTPAAPAAPPTQPLPPTAPTTPARPAPPEPAAAPPDSIPDHSAPTTAGASVGVTDAPTVIAPASGGAPGASPSARDGVAATQQLPSTPLVPAAPDVRQRSRSRLPAVLGAVVAVALGAAAVLWVTRSGDDESSDNPSESSDATDATDAGATTTPADTDVNDTAAPEPTPPSEPTPTSTPVVLPTAPPTVAPTAPADTAAPTVSVLPAPPVPGGATLFSDPAGWTIAVDPAWEFQQSDEFTGWFTGTGSSGFRDNVNVALEDLASPLALDAYVVAATGFINTQATEVEIVDQRRLVGDDGVEVHVITWLGAVGGASQRLAFVQAMTVTATKAYVATFTSQPGRLLELATVIGPYLATIRGI